MRNEKSDIRFIEWSNSRKIYSYDTFFAIGVLDTIKNKENIIGLDIGGGIGRFALNISDSINSYIDVVDPSLLAKNNFLMSDKLNLINVDFQNYKSDKKYDFIFLNLVLHHVLGDDEFSTENAQKYFLIKAIEHFKDDGFIFIQENYYDGLLGSDITGKLIFKLTRAKFLKRFTRTMGANTAGEGVRFRSKKSWNKVFENLDIHKISEVSHPDWAKRFPPIKELDKYWIHIAREVITRLVLLCSDRSQTMSVFKKNTKIFD